MPMQHARRAKNGHRLSKELELSIFRSMQCAQATSQDSTESLVLQLTPGPGSALLRM